MKQEFITPEFNETAFNCPFCNAYSNQVWFDSAYYNNGYQLFRNGKVCYCVHCKKFSIWYERIMVYPDFQGVQTPNGDLNDDIKADYEEAASILQKSPRGAAALLRLAVQKLCKELGEEGNDINKDIKELVSKGLPSAVQKSLDAVRVIGNEAVHPGQIDLRDDVETAQVLFRLVNLIAEKMITEPKEVESIYASLPETKRQQIDRRDQK